MRGASLIAALALAASACDDGDVMPAPAPPHEVERAAAPIEPAAEPTADAVPDDPLAIRDWLRRFAYRGWEAQSPVHATGEHGGARVFLDPTLAASIKAGASEHPIGAAAVRELYAADLVTLRGFALMLKKGPSGPEGEGWFWYEFFETTAEARPLVAETGARGCVGCHAAGVDFVQPPELP